MVRLVFEAFLLTLVNILSLLGLAIRFLPHILTAARYLAQLFVAASVFVYRLILTRLAPFAAFLHVDLLNGLWRLVATTLLSVAIGVGIVLVVRWSITPTSLIASGVHGLLIGMVWDNLGPPSNGLTLGV